MAGAEVASPDGESRRFLQPTGLMPMLIDDLERFHPVDHSWFASNQPTPPDRLWTQLPGPGIPGNSADRRSAKLEIR